MRIAGGRLRSAENHMLRSSFNMVIHDLLRDQRSNDYSKSTTISINASLTSIGDLAAKNIVRHCEKMIKLIDYFLLPYAGSDTLSLWLEMYLSLMT